MNKSQLTGLIIRPLLRDIPHGLTEIAVLCIQMLIAHESRRGEYISQLHGGPAAGIIQMERATHAAVWTYGDTVWDNAVLAGIITPYDKRYALRPDFDRLLYDLKYNIFMARQRLFMKPEAIPGDPMEISVYLKKHWNSVAGAANYDSYYKAWLEWG